MHQILKGAGHGEHLFGHPIHGTGFEFEESTLPPVKPFSMAKKHRLLCQRT
jgi:Xaa-Pro aminopeptidase